MRRLITSSPICLVLGFALCVSAVSAEETSLFDGKSLEGWRGQAELWTVEDGAIVGRTSASDPIKTNTFLIYDGETPSDFELRLRYRIESGNSGVQYRSRVVDEDKFIVGGYQADIEVTNHYTGINYEERGRGILAQRGQRVTIAADGEKQVESFADGAEIAKSFKVDGWNDYKIVAKGNRLQHFINDVLTCEVIDGQPEKAATEGVIALQLHVGPPMVVKFKEIVIDTIAD